MDAKNSFIDGRMYFLLTNEENSGNDCLGLFISRAIELNKKVFYFGDGNISGDIKSNIVFEKGIEESILNGDSFSFESVLKLWKVKKNRGDILSLLNNREKSVDLKDIAVVIDMNMLKLSEEKRMEICHYKRQIESILIKNNIFGIIRYNLDKYNLENIRYMVEDEYNIAYSQDGKVFVLDSFEKDVSTVDIKRMVFNFIKDNEKIKRENRVYQFISQLAFELSYRKDEREIIETALKTICNGVYANYGMVILNHEEKEDFESSRDAITYNVPPEVLNVYFKRAKLWKSFDKNVIGELDFMIHRVDDFEDSLRELYLRNNIYSSISLPLINEGTVLGYIWIATFNEHVFFNENLDFLIKVSSTITRMLMENRKFEKIQNDFMQARKMKALGELTGGIAHEFNNVLTPILGYIQIIRDRIEDPILQRYVEMIEESAKDGSKIVRRIQDYTRFKISKRELVEIDRVISQSIEITKPKWTFESQMQRRFIKVNLDLKSRGLVEGCATELREVFINIISNSIDAMPKGGYINITSKNIGDYIEISIQDSGTGIRREIKDRIFEPFFTTKNEKGNGLGLSIAYDIIKSMDGNIDVISQVGLGTTFIITFPLKGFGGKIMKVDDLHNKNKRYRILVIDDQQPVAETVCEMLKSVGHECTYTTNCEEALSTFLEKKYDVIVCDLAMPGLSGTEVAEKIKEINPKTRFILMTGWPGKLTDKELKFIDQIIQKPFTIQEISNLLSDNKKMVKTN